MLNRNYATLLTIAALAGSASAADLHVPAQFPTIQSAVDAAEPFDHIIVASGDFDEYVEVRLKDDLTITGSDQTLVGSMDISWSDRVTVENLAFSTLDDDHLLLHVSSRESVTVRSCTFAGGKVNIQGDVILEDSTFSATNFRASSVQCRGNRFTGGEIWMFGQNQVEQCVFKKLLVMVTGAGGTTILNNTFRRSRLLIAHGAYHVADNTFIRCQTDDSRGYALRGAYLDGSVIERNLVKRSSLGGILIEGNNNIVRYNCVIKAARIGMEIYTPNIPDRHSSNNLIFSNTIKRSRSIGLYVDDASTGNRIESNTIKRNSSWDIFDEGGSGQNEYIDNTIETSNL